MTFIVNYGKTESGNLANNFEWFADEIARAEKLQYLFEELKDIMGDIPDDQHLAQMFLFQQAQDLFVNATLSVLRLHCGYSFFFARRAIEGTASAYRIFRHPEDAVVWVGRHKDPDRFKQCFNFSTLFPDKYPLIAELKEYYDSSSRWGVHANFETVVDRYAEPLVAGGNLTFQCFDTNPKMLFQHIMWHQAAFVKILKVFVECFSKLNSNQDKFLTKVSIYQGEHEKFIRERCKHFGIIEGE